MKSNLSEDQAIDVIKRPDYVLLTLLPSIRHTGNNIFLLELNVKAQKNKPSQARKKWSIRIESPVGTITRV